jgi:hypothetical protein
MHLVSSVETVQRAIHIGNGLSTTDSITDYGKTRAQVRAGLLEAHRAGTVPVHTNDYPPSVETVARNQTRFRQIEQAWRAGGPVVATNQ